MSKHQWLQLLPKIILAFITSVALAVTGILLCIKMTIFSQEFMIQQATTSNYVTLTTNDINEYMQDNARGSNIPPEVIKDTVSKKLVQANISSFIRAIYTDVPYRLTGEEEIRAKMKEAIETYAKKNDLALDDEANKNIAALIDQNIDVFESYVAIPSFRHYAKQVMLYNQKFTLLIVTTVVVDLLLLLALGLISGKYWHRKLRYYAYVFGGTALMLLVLPTILYLGGAVKRVAVRSEALYGFITTYINQIMLTVIKCGGLFALICLCSILASELYRRKVSRR